MWNKWEKRYRKNIWCEIQSYFLLITSKYYKIKCFKNNILRELESNSNSFKNQISSNYKKQNVT